MKKYLLIFLLLVMSGCVPPYKPPKVTVDKPIINNTTVVDVTNVKPSAAFDNYKKDTAANYRQLAKECLSGTYEYVSELVDASVRLDKVAKLKRNKPIDSMFQNALGSDKLDSAKAAAILNSIADDLDPEGKPVVIETPKPVVIETPKPVVIETPTIETPKPKVTTAAPKRKTVYCTQSELLAKCRNGIAWSVSGKDVHSHLIQEHGFTSTQLTNLSSRQCYLLHSNVHNGYIQPTKVIYE